MRARVATETPPQVPTRERLVELLASLESAKEAREKLNEHPIQVEYDAAIRAELTRRFPRKKSWTWEEVVKQLPEQVREGIKAPFVRRFEEIASAMDRRVAQIDVELTKVAEALSPRPGSDQRLFVSVRASQYRILGVEEMTRTFARVWAELQADIPRMYKIDTEVVCDEDDGDCDVLVRVEEKLDLALLRYAPGPSTREIARRSWALGVNPRVYMPWLPVNYEELVKIDERGGDLAHTTK